MGNIIFIEGSNGVGKSTLINNLMENERLIAVVADRDMDMYSINEPYGQIERPEWINKEYDLVLNEIRTVLKSGVTKEPSNMHYDQFLRLARVGKSVYNKFHKYIDIIKMCEYAITFSYDAFMDSVNATFFREKYSDATIRKMFEIASKPEHRASLVEAALFTISRITVFRLINMYCKKRKDVTDLNILVDRSFLSTVIFQIAPLDKFRGDTEIRDFLFDMFIAPLKYAIYELDKAGLAPSFVLLSNSPHQQTDGAPDIYDEVVERSHTDKMYDRLFNNDTYWRLYTTKPGNFYFSSKKIKRKVIDMRINKIDDIMTLNDLLLMIYES